MAYENLEMIVVFNGAKSAFTPSSYKDKLVLITGNPNAPSNDDKDSYIYAIDSAGNYKAIQVPNAFVRGYKVNSGTAYGGIVNFAASNGITVSYKDGTVTFDADTLSKAIVTAQNKADQADTTANAALTKAGNNETAITNLKNGDTGSIRDIAADEVDKLRDEVFGDSTETDSIPALREDIDRIDGDYKVGLTANQDGSYTVTQGNQSIGMINIPKDKVVQSGSVVRGTWANDKFTESTSGAGHAIKLVLQNSNDVLYINVADLVDVYTAQANAAQVQIAISATNVISASIKSGSITATELASNAVTTAKINAKAVTKAKLEQDVQDSLALADNAAQEVASGTEDYIAVAGSSLEGGGKRFNFSAVTTTMGDVSSDATKKGLATAEDVFAFLKARLSVKVQ